MACNPLLPLQSRYEAVFDQIHPKHAGHKKLAVPQSTLVFEAICDWCQVTLKVTMMQMMLAETAARMEQSVVGSLATEKDDRFPHDCPRCKGPAYIGGNNNVDCKKKCS